MRATSLHVTAITLAAAALAATGCAKRPAMTQATAPPPVVAAPAPAPPPPPPPAPAPAPPPVAAAPAPAPAPPPVAAPAPPPAPPPADFAAVPELQPIHFDFDKSAIRPGDARILDTSAQWLKEHPDMLVLVEGHCDERGTPEYNLALGDRRAKAAVNYLVGKGIEASRFVTVSYGEDRPQCTEKTRDCYARNRRDQFLVKPR